MNRGEIWIGTVIACWFCFLYGGIAAVGIAIVLAAPGGLAVAHFSEELTSLGTRLKTGYPIALAGVAVLIGVAGMFSKR